MKLKNLKPKSTIYVFVLWAIFFGFILNKTLHSLKTLDENMSTQFRQIFELQPESNL